jgi:3-phosphoglycerate kinase
MGVFEWPPFAEGTKAVAQAVAASDGIPSSAAPTQLVR